jgi:hypothetical protein
MEVDGNILHEEGCTAPVPYGDEDAPPVVVLSECCRSYMAADERFCPKCGYACRIVAADGPEEAR